MRIAFPESTGLINNQRKDGIDIKTTDTTFADFLKMAITEVDKLQRDADASAVALATGDVQNLHQVMIDAEKAEIALQFTIQIRNKILEAYQEIMRMQV